MNVTLQVCYNMQERWTPVIHAILVVQFFSRAARFFHVMQIQRNWLNIETKHQMKPNFVTFTKKYNWNNLKEQSYFTVSWLSKNLKKFRVIPYGTGVAKVEGLKSLLIEIEVKKCWKTGVLNFDCSFKDPVYTQKVENIRC